MENCKGECNGAFDECENNPKGRRCEIKREYCEKQCDAATQCTPCEDDVPEGFGPFWCQTNVKSATFCGSADGEKKCKKTCSICN